MSDTAPKTDPYAAWRNRDFRFYALGWFTMTFAKQIETLAIAVFFVSVFSETDAPVVLGLMGLVQAMPMMLLAIPAGQLADRVDRRKVVLTVFALGTLSSTALLGVTLWSGSTTLIFVCLGLGAISQAVGSPSRAALLPQLIEKELFANAVSWNSSVFYLAMVTGPAFAGFVVAMSKDSTSVLENPAPAMMIVVACRFVALAAIAMIRYRQTEWADQAVSWQSVLAGVRFVWRTKLILATITLDLFAVLLGGATYLLPIFAKDILHVGSVGLGFLRAADAIGAVSMSVFLVHLPPMKRAGVALLWAVAGFGLATVIFGLSQWFWLSLLMMFMVGALDNISVVVRHTLVQMLTPDSMRGRVSAVNNVFIVASNDLGGLESGLTAWLFGPVLSVIGGGIGTILVVIGVAFVFPQILKIGSLHTIQPAELEEYCEEDH
jgi:MFS family permease